MEVTTPWSIAARPRRRYRTGWVTRGLRWASLLGMLALTIVVLRRYPDLPATVPTRLGAGGEVDDVGPRWSVLVLLGLMWVMIAAIGWLSGRPRILSYPLAVTTANAQRLYREGERLCVWLMPALVLVTVGMVTAILGGVDDGDGAGAASSLGVVLIGVGLAACVLATVAGIVRALRIDGQDDDEYEYAYDEAFDEHDERTRAQGP